MTDIAQRGNKLTRTGYAKGGRIGKNIGGVMKAALQHATIRAREPKKN